MNSYFQNGFKNCITFPEADDEMIFGVPSEYVCMQSGLLNENEDSLFHIPSNDTFHYFNPAYDLIPKSQFSLPKLDYKSLLSKSDAEDETSDAIVQIEEVAEQEIIADPLHLPSLYPDVRFSDVLGVADSLDFSRLICELCHLDFYEKTLLLRHISSKHKRTATFECSKCGQIFCRKKSIINHLKYHDSVRVSMGFDVFSVTRSYSSFPKSALFHSSSLSNSKNEKIRNHKRKITTKKTPKIKLEKLEDEEDPINRIARLTCKYCGKVCKDFRGFKKHSSVHSDGHYLKCHICGKQFCTRTALKRHMLSHEDKNVICDICGVKVPDYRALANHRSSLHPVVFKNGCTTARIFPCHACDKIFSSRTSQQIHLRVHTGERPYSCRFCVKAFADGGTLKKHERIHTGEKPYVCPICSKAANQRVVLREHIRLHHTDATKTEGNHWCEVCNEICDSAQSLCSHLVKHSDENTAKHRVSAEKPRKYHKKLKHLADSDQNRTGSGENNNNDEHDSTIILSFVEEDVSFSVEPADCEKVKCLKAVDEFLLSSDLIVKKPLDDDKHDSPIHVNISSVGNVSVENKSNTEFDDIILVTIDDSNGWRESSSETKSSNLLSNEIVSKVSEAVIRPFHQKTRRVLSYKTTN